MTVSETVVKVRMGYDMILLNLKGREISIDTDDYESVVIGGMQKHQSVKTDGICPTLTSSMGCGGGYVPMILEVNKNGIISTSERGSVEDGGS